MPQQNDNGSSSIVLITGANRGIGFEIAWQLAHRGCTLILTGRDSADLKRAHEEFESVENARVTTAVLDVASSSSIRAAAKAVGEQVERIDVLINNAGIVRDEDRALLDTPESDVMRTIQTNAVGPLLVTQALLPLIPNGGRIINVSSDAGRLSQGISDYAPAYAISKSLLNVITRHMARELAPRKISVNAVCPGWVRTDMGGPKASRSVEKGAETPVWLALDAPSRLTGKFVRDKKEIPW
jgi:NAD(P)-dependent dehydrogenase (short-subunit alcohol dehydrogenase family)